MNKHQDISGKISKNKTTWGNVEPGPRNEKEESSLRAAEANAAKEDCSNVSSPNMDPESHEGESNEPKEEGTQNWQQLNTKEKERTDRRKDGYPKN